MRSLTGVVCLIGVTLIGSSLLHASLIPILHLDEPTLKAYQDYVNVFEKDVVEQFSKTGKMWADNNCCAKRSMLESGKILVEPRRNEDLVHGSIHHFSGTMHLKKANIESIRRVMQDYAHYPQIFKNDLSSASGTKEADSTPEDEHYLARLMLVSGTMWMNVSYDTLYDTHYRRVAKDRWTTRSIALSIKELRNPKDLSEGTWPEGEDHGFLWKTNTYWLARERNGGLDLQADSIALSRPNVTGFAWWGTRRSHDAVEKILRDVKAAIENPIR